MSTAAIPFVDEVHAWHPHRGTVCSDPQMAPKRSVDVDKLTCEDCKALVPAPGESWRGITNDAGVLRRAAVGASS